MAYQPGEVVNGYVLTADRSHWLPVGFASAFDRWAGYALAMADFTGRHEASSPEYGPLWADCSAICVRARLFASATLAMWRHAGLQAAWLVGLADRGTQLPAESVWDAHEATLSALHCLRNAADKHLSVLAPGPLRANLDAHLTVLDGLTWADMAGITGRARQAGEISANLLRLWGPACGQAMLDEVWLLADNPAAIHARLGHHIADPRWSRLATPRPDDVLGAALRSGPANTLDGKPGDCVDPSSASLLPDWLHAI